MAWTYLPTDLSTDLAKVRREIGDTNEDDQLLQDEELELALTAEGSVLLAAARAADWIARTFARDFDFEADGTKIMKAGRAKAYRELASELRSRGDAEASGTGGIGVVHTVNIDGYQTANAALDHQERTSPYA
jgi:hypothetical protein